jgi:hypothetical protein
MPKPLFNCLLLQSKFIKCNQQKHNTDDHIKQKKIYNDCADILKKYIEQCGANNDKSFALAILATH